MPIENGFVSIKLDEGSEMKLEVVTK